MVSARATMRASVIPDRMTIKSQLVGTTTILRVHGTMTAAAGERGLREVIRQAAADGVRTVIVNMQDATAIDSSGVSDLASGHMFLANSGGSLKLCCLSKKLRDIFVVTRLDTVFDIHETEAAAVASVEQASDRSSSS
jgi:anti-sigma B factor antagonist